MKILHGGEFVRCDEIENGKGMVESGLEPTADRIPLRWSSFDEEALFAIDMPPLEGSGFSDQGPEGCPSQLLCFFRRGKGIQSYFR